MEIHEQYMNRCLVLAQMGSGQAAPNPMVGAVLVHNNRIIGEGYHQQYGAAHAEVNCINSVSPIDEPLIAAATLYVSLEPCAHVGKTPPCSLLIIEKKIPRVVIAVTDPFAQVAGRGIQLLQEAGIEVIAGVLEREAAFLNRRFFTFQQQQRPYVILKWAQTADGKIAGIDNNRLMISNAVVQRKVHQWRSEEMAIWVGSETALKDNPQLNNRLWSGKTPIRMVLDRQLRLPASLHLFDQQQPTIVFNQLKNAEDGNISYRKIGDDVIPSVLQQAHALGIQSILVEGGATLLQIIMDSGLWDETRIITNTQMHIGAGIAAPDLPKGLTTYAEEKIHADTIHYYLNPHAAKK